MTIGYVAASAAAISLLAGAASAQPYYGYGQLPPAPYVEAGGYQGGGYGGACNGGQGFTLLGARAGVTVLGFDLGADAHFNAPAIDCGGGEAPAPAFAPAPPAPPPEPMGYGSPPPSYGYESYGYAPQPMAPPPQPWAYARPCGCEAGGW